MTNAAATPDRPERAEPLAGSRWIPHLAQKFVWGPIDSVHQIGKYLIVEYRDDRSKMSPSHQSGHGETKFHPYVDGVDTCTQCDSLEEAIVCAIGFEREGPGSTAAHYFFRMTRADK